MKSESETSEGLSYREEIHDKSGKYLYSEEYSSVTRSAGPCRKSMCLSSVLNETVSRGCETGRGRKLLKDHCYVYFVSAEPRYNCYRNPVARNGKYTHLTDYLDIMEQSSVNCV